jgi:hypothetical protein
MLLGQASAGSGHAAHSHAAHSHAAHSPLTMVTASPPPLPPGVPPLWQVGCRDHPHAWRRGGPQPLRPQASAGAKEAGWRRAGGAGAAAGAWPAAATGLPSQQPPAPRPLTAGAPSAPSAPPNLPSPPTPLPSYSPITFLSFNFDTPDQTPVERVDKDTWEVRVDYVGSPGHELGWTPDGKKVRRGSGRGRGRDAAAGAWVMGARGLRQRAAWAVGGALLCLRRLAAHLHSSLPPPTCQCAPPAANSPLRISRPRPHPSS